MAVIVQVVGDYDGKQLAQAHKDLRKLGADLKSTGQESAKSGDIGKVAGAAHAAGSNMAAVAAAAAGLAMFATAKKASDLAEVVSKSRVVFGKQSKAIEDWANGSADAMGMSKTAALDAASGFGTMFTQLGFTTGKAAEMSTSMVDLSADIASYNNVQGGAAEVADMMSSAMRGEYDSIQRVIPTINAAAVQSEAMAQTGKRNAQSLTEQEKAAAAYALIMKGAGPAVGDFERTQDGAANSMRIFEAEADNAQTTFGDAFLPAMTKGIKVGSAALKVFNGLPSPIKDTAAGLSLVAIAGFALSPALSGAVKGTRELVGWMGTYRRSAKEAAVATDALAGAQGRAAGTGFLATLSSAAKLLGPVAAAVAAVTAKVKVMHMVQDEAVTAMADNFRQLAESGTALGDAFHVETVTGDLTSIEQVMTAATSKSVTFAAAQDQIKTSFKGLDEYLSGMDIGAATVEFDKLATRLGAVGISADDLRGMLPGYVAMVKDAGGAAQVQSDAEQSKADALREVRDAQQEVIDAMMDAIDIQLALAGAGDDLAGIQDELTEHVARMAKEYGKGATSLDRHSKAGRENRSEISQNIKKLQASYSATIANAKANGETTEQAMRKGQAAMEKGRKGLIESAVAAGFSRKEITKYINKIMGIPDETNTDVKANIRDLQGKLSRAKSELSDPNLTKERRAQLNADIAKLEKAVRDAKSRMGEVKNKQVTITISARLRQANPAAWAKAERLTGQNFSISSSSVSVSSMSAMAAGDMATLSSAAFTKLGSAVVSNLVRGLRDSKKKVRKAAQSVVNEINDAMDDARQRISDLKGEGRDLGRTLSRGLGDFGEGTKDFLTGMAESTTTADSMLADMRASVTALNDWRGSLDRAAKKGLPRDIVEELRAMGLDSSDELRALNSMTDAQLKEWVGLWRQRDRSGAAEGAKQVADDIAKVVSSVEAKFESIGANAMKGLGKGLRSQSKTVRKRLQHLMDDIVADAKKALGIKSPSTVFAGIGSNVVLGMREGMADERAGLLKDVARIALPTTLPAATEPARAGTGTRSVVIAPGAVQVTVTGGPGGATPAEIRREVEAALKKLLREVMAS